MHYQSKVKNITLSMDARGDYRACVIYEDGLPEAVPSRIRGQDPCPLIRVCRALSFGLSPFTRPSVMIFLAATLSASERGRRVCSEQ